MRKGKNRCLFRVARIVRARANSSVARANCDCILREGRTKGWTTFAAVTACTRALSINPARIVVQADGRGRQRGTTAGRHGQRAQTDVTPVPLGRYDAILIEKTPPISANNERLRFFSKHRSCNRAYISSFLVRFHHRRGI